jgi:hypothetical protein
MPPELRALLQRYNQLGCLLPPLANVHERAEEAKLVLAEMGAVQAEIDSLLAAAQQEASGRRRRRGRKVELGIVVADGEDSHDG